MKEIRKLNAVESIRVLSAIIGQEIEELTLRLAMINLLTRYILGDAEEDFTVEQMKRIGIDLIKK